MRSIFLHLRDVRIADVNHLLLQICRPGSRPGKDPMWVFEVEGDPCLYIDFDTEGPREFEPEYWAALVRTLGGEPAVSLIVDISGRHASDQQVREFVLALLSKFDGVAQDEYTEHCRTLQDIVSRHEVEGHPFFDYLGWYN